MRARIVRRIGLRALRWRRTGPLVVTTANAPGLPAPADADDASEQLGDAVGLVLDAGPLTSGGEHLPSTIVDATSDTLRIDPTTKMTKFVYEEGRTGLGELFDVEARAQFEAIWRELSRLARGN